MSADALSSFDPAAPHYPDVIIAAAREFAPGLSTGAHSHDRDRDHRANPKSERVLQS
jgi:hypothetical protein